MINIKCDKCKHEFSLFEKHCPNCGDKVKISTKFFCNDCGKEIDIYQKKCKHCNKIPDKIIIKTQSGKEIVTDFETSDIVLNNDEEKYHANEKITKNNETKREDGKISIIIGIIAFVTAFYNALLGVICASIGVVLGIMGLTKKDKKSIIGIIISLIPIVLFITSVIITAKQIENNRKHVTHELFMYDAQDVVYKVIDSDSSNEFVCIDKVTGESGETFVNIEELGSGEYYMLFSSNDNKLIEDFNNINKSVAMTIRRKTEEYEEETAPLNRFKYHLEKEPGYGWIHWTKDGNRNNYYYITIAFESGYGIPDEVEYENINMNTISKEGASVDMMKAINAINNDTSIDGKEAIGGKTYYCYYQG